MSVPPSPANANSSTGSSRPFSTAPKSGSVPRSYKLLGLRASDILESVFQPIKDANVQPGRIARSEFFNFWRQMTLADEAVPFMEKTMAMLVTACDTKTNSTHGIPTVSLINTVAFAALSLKFTNSSTITAFINSNQDNQALREVARILMNRVDKEKGPSHDEDKLGPLILLATALYTIKDLSSVPRPVALDESDIGSNELGFVYQYLWHLAHESSEWQQALLLALFRKVPTLPQQAKMNPRMAEATMLAMFHLLQAFLRADSVQDEGLLQRALATVQPLILWPKPLCTVAQHAFELIQAEKLSAGATRRSAMDNEALVVDYFGIEKEPGYKHCKPLFYLYLGDKEDLAAMTPITVIDGITFAESSIVKPQPITSDPSGGLALPPPIQALWLLHFLSTATPVAPGDEQKQRAKDVELVGKLDPKRLSTLLEKVRECDHQVAQAFNPDNDSTLDIRAKYANDIRSQLESMPAATTDRVNILECKTSLTPRFPSLEHVRVPVSTRRGTKEEKGSYFPAGGVGDALYSILSRYAADPSTPVKYPRLVRIAIAGGDLLLHLVAAAYSVLRRRNPEVFHGLRIRFFVIPTAKNCLAGYMARHDPWYSRHVYNVFRSQPLAVPWCRDGDPQGEGKQLDSNTQIEPTRFLRDCVSQYVREANITIPTTIYHLEGFSEAKMDEPDEVIPFVQRAEIGLAAYTEEMRQRTKTTKNEKDKAPPFQPPELSVRFTQVDLVGRAIQEVNEDPLAYQSLVLISIPRKNDLAAPANPAVPSLELYAQANKAEKSSKVRKAVLVAEPRQHVGDVSITAASPASKFRVVVDGVMYGPYESVRITTAKDGNAVPIVLPVQTFFPIDP